MSSVSSAVKEPHVSMDSGAGEEEVFHTKHDASRRQGVWSILNKKDNKVDKPLDGGLVAWLQVLACGIIVMNNFGLASAFGVYQAYYQEFLLSDHSASSIAWIGTLQAALTLIVGVGTGPLFDKGYFFSVVIIASLGLVFSFMMLSLCHQYWQIFLCQGLIAGLCSGALYVPSVAQIPQYFQSNLGLALGTTLSGASIGGIVYPLLFRRLLVTVGFGWATRGIGFLAAALLLIAVILVKPLDLADRPEKVFDKTIFKSIYFNSFIVAGFFTFAAIFIPFFDSATFFWNNFEHDLNKAFYTLLIVNAGNFIGRFFLTTINDYKFTHFLGPEGVIFTTIFGTGVLGFAWIGIRSTGSYYLFLILWGICSGANASLPPLVIRILVPRRELFATSMGILYTSAGLGVLVGVPIANAITAQGWLGTQVMTGVFGMLASVFAAICVVGVRRLRLAAKATPQA